MLRCSKILFAVLLWTAFSYGQVKIAAFGSSVCNGTGDEKSIGGYVGRLTTLMKKYNFSVINVSRGGDNTIKIQDRWEKSNPPKYGDVKDNQYLIPVNPKYVIIGLSLANEGLIKKSTIGRDSIFEQFRSGMLGIISKCRQLGYIPIVANCYPNHEYNTDEYTLVKEMNLIISSWDIPSFDLLGSIDDGSGHWCSGFYRDGWHPSSGGHREMFFSIPPTLFSALEKGKVKPKFINHNKFFQVKKSTGPAFVYEPADTIHSFTVSFSVRNFSDLKLITVEGSKCLVDSSAASVNLFSTGENYNTVLKIEKGNLVYNSGGTTYSVPFTGSSYKWQLITLTHQPSLGITSVYIQDSLSLTVNERIIPRQFDLISEGSAQVKNILIYRSALNRMEVLHNSSGKLFTSSLEIYSPLNDKIPLNGSPLNYAQTLSLLKRVK